ncbi:isochorismate synthase [Spirosoma sp.]|uniref:isochorismate synthase n=1 Tax=Spirosoma sp. TaxID=1899569 RepID=UPI003B3A07B7
MQSDYSFHTTSLTRVAEHHPQAIDFWETARSLGVPAALWRLPNQREKHLIVSFDEVLPRVAADLDELPAGFLISPFDNITDGLSDDEKSAKTLFLRADLQVVFSDNNQIDIKNTAEETAADFWQALMTSARRSSNQAVSASAVTLLSEPDIETNYVRNVAEAVEAMQRGDFRKVVLSRTKHVVFADAPNAVSLFDKLCQTYPTAFVSAVSIPERGQIWISATPERLVSTDANGIFQTAALAGTQSVFNPDGTTKRPAEAMWSQKEIEEQAIVCRYIIECFKKIRLREYIEEGPKSIVAGNLMHLGTRFTVDTQAVRYPQLGTVMLRLLHPTSAVCGTPRDVAFSFIREHETHNRELYSGFLGPVNIDTSEGAATDIFVHIRCMKLEGKLATLYAGAGLTEDSDPEREWQETEMKCQTLLKVILTNE